MNVSLTPSLEEFTEKVEFSLYDNASEVIREALRLMHDGVDTGVPNQVFADDEFESSRETVAPWPTF